MKVFFVLAALGLMTLVPLPASVSSSTGTLTFSPQEGAAAVMSLSSNGLMVGSGAIASANLEVQGNAIVTEKLQIGGGSLGSSNLQLNGSLGIEPKMVTSDVTLSEHSMAFANTASDNLVVTLPYAGNVIGRKVTIKKTSSSGNLYVSGGGNLIDGRDYQISGTGNLSSLSLFCDGASWRTMSSYHWDPSSSANASAHWAFDESSGTLAADASGSGHGGNLKNGLDFSSASVVGKRGKALQFNATSFHAIQVDDHSVFQSPVFSITFWVKPHTSFISYSRIISKNNVFDTNDGFIVLFQTDASQKIYGVVRSGGATYSTFNDETTIELNEWRHYAYTYDGSHIRGYHNGSLISTVSATYTPNTTLPLTIGARADNINQNNINMFLDDLRYYNRALTEEEVSIIHGFRTN